MYCMYMYIYRSIHMSMHISNYSSTNLAFAISASLFAAATGSSVMPCFAWAASRNPLGPSAHVRCPTTPCALGHGALGRGTSEMGTPVRRRKLENGPFQCNALSCCSCFLLKIGHVHGVMLDYRNGEIGHHSQLKRTISDYHQSIAM